MQVAVTGVEPHARGLCLYQEGDSDGAARLLEAAAETFAALHRPVEEGRTHLARGRVERRRRRASAARLAWAHALALFTEAQARPWITLVEDHLGALAGTVTPGAAALPSAAKDGLTARERRLADLVRAGCTNEEAAQRIFVSRKTVEAMLSRVYRKTGVRNRTELAAFLELSDTSAPPSDSPDDPGSVRPA
ncbi:hypothetical protein GTY65_38180 [Streptomyces sp. SID8379]|uniref:helix-turn-helix transcriptional regulator n=1 Tax=unclassified Streptomyces TaxID=2593676 RepID=UPI00131A2BFD|nr:helix-turn-helix transcriptional regulator [Streptomyces sp. HmicA12]MYW69844.1 hypothetical protein [Streptomyces sp. SID8379]